MNIDLIPIGDDPPENVNVIIEVPVGGEPVKYEFDKKSGALFVDRILHTAMRYPANYGFVPHTLSFDGDPIDALVIARSPFVPGSVVRARPIGVLNLEDEHGGDEKLICVPIDSTFPYYSDVGERQDLPSIILQQIAHFFRIKAGDTPLIVSNELIGFLAGFRQTRFHTGIHIAAVQIA